MLKIYGMFVQKYYFVISNLLEMSLHFHPETGLNLTIRFIFLWYGNAE